MTNDFTVGEVSPKRQSRPRAHRAGQVLLPVINRSQTNAKFRLDAADHTGVCHFEFQLPGETTSLAQQAELRLAPGQTVDITVRIIPPPPPLIALGKPMYYFTVTTTMLAGTYPSRSVLGQLSTTPIIGPWSVSLAAICLIGLLIYMAQIIMLAAPVSQPVERRRPTPPPQIYFDGEDTFSTAVDGSSPVNEEEAVDRAEMTYEEIFREVAPQYDLDWRLLAALAYQESGMDPLAIGKDSDLGLMQIIPSTWYQWAPQVGVTDPFDPYSNVLVGAAYLAYVRDYARSRGYEEEYWMLVGYNWGPNNLRQIFNNNQDWAQIPEKRRRYALDILQTRSMGVDWGQMDTAPAESNLVNSN